MPSPTDLYFERQLILERTALACQRVQEFSAAVSPLVGPAMQKTITALNENAARLRSYLQAHGVSVAAPAPQPSSPPTPQPEHEGDERPPAPRPSVQGEIVPFPQPPRAGR